MIRGNFLRILLGNICSGGGILALKILNTYIEVYTFDCIYFKDDGNYE